MSARGRLFHWSTHPAPWADEAPGSREATNRQRMITLEDSKVNQGVREECLFWTLPLGDNLAYILRMEAVEQGAAVQLTIPDVGVFRIPIVRRSLPRRGGFAILYRCPGCARPRRYLYLRSLAFGRLVAYQGPLCQACAGLRWASQGRYIWTLARALRVGLGLHPSARLPIPRHPWDPRAVSDPRLILDEFPDLVGDRQIGPGPGTVTTVDQSEESDAGG